MYHLSLFVILVTAGSCLTATLSKTNAQLRQTPFFATKGGQLQQPQQQEEEAALPNFVEPPAAPVPEPDAGQPMMPYEFEYAAAATGGSSARRESNDGQRVTGTYTLSGADGISRVVHYVADKDGFRATIVTNEPGTESQSPSGVILNSSQLPAEQIALQYGKLQKLITCNLFACKLLSTVIHEFIQIQKQVPVSPRDPLDRLSQPLSLQSLPLLLHPSFRWHPWFSYSSLLP